MDRADATIAAAIPAALRSTCIPLADEAFVAALSFFRIDGEELEELGSGLIRRAEDGAARIPLADEAFVAALSCFRLGPL
jgi:hypothetical protein